MTFAEGSSNSPVKSHQSSPRDRRLEEKDFGDRRRWFPVLMEPAQEISGTSAQVGQVLEVLSQIRAEAPEGIKQVREARLRAVKVVALHRGIRPKSVTDKCWRKLGITIQEFDTLVHRWLNNRGNELRNVLLDNVAQGHEVADEFAVKVFFAGGYRSWEGERAAELDLARRSTEERDERLVEHEIRERFRVGEFSVPDSFSQQQVRLGHRKWRKLVLENFNFRCAVCGLSIPPLLDAAHLVGWSESPAHRLDPTNGISLCVLHHRAYDRGLMAFVGQEIEVSPVLSRDSQQNREFLLRYHGESIEQPRIWDLLEINLPGERSP